MKASAASALALIATAGRTTVANPATSGPAAATPGAAVSPPLAGTVCPRNHACADRQPPTVPARWTALQSALQHDDAVVQAVRLLLHLPGLERADEALPDREPEARSQHVSRDGADPPSVPPGIRGAWVGASPFWLGPYLKRDPNV